MEEIISVYKFCDRKETEYMLSIFHKPKLHYLQIFAFNCGLKYSIFYTCSQFLSLSLSQRENYSPVVMALSLDDGINKLLISPNASPTLTNTLN